MPARFEIQTVSVMLCFSCRHQDIPIVRPASHGTPVNSPKSPLSPAKGPGVAERVAPVTMTAHETGPARPLTEDEAHRLDQECLQRFIKINVKHITDGQVSVFSKYALNRTKTRTIRGN